MAMEGGAGRCGRGDEPRAMGVPAAGGRGGDGGGPGGWFGGPGCPGGRRPISLAAELDDRCSPTAAAERGIRRRRRRRQAARPIQRAHPGAVVAGGRAGAGMVRAGGRRGVPGPRALRLTSEGD